MVGIRVREDLEFHKFRKLPNSQRTIVETISVDESGNYISPSGQSASVEDYKLNGWEESSMVTYTFNLKTNGRWLIIKYDESAKTVRYANISNNATMTTYDLAVTNYLTLTYDKLEEITDL